MSTVEYEITNEKSLADIARQYIGQKIAVICDRYQYRGFCSNVCDDCITLSDAVAVEISGACNNDRPNREDPICGAAHIRYQKMEILYQPKWVHAPLPSEPGYRSGQEPDNEQGE